MTFLLQLRPSLFFFFPISFRFPLQHNLLFNAESIVSAYHKSQIQPLSINLIILRALSPAIKSHPLEEREKKNRTILLSVTTGLSKRQTEEAVTWTTELLLADKSTSKTSHHSAYKGPPNDSCFRIVPTLGNSNNSQIP
ncbi:guanine nucleotide-binding protein G(I)/G(S)/G(O) subunit gamma-13 isoform X1 [Pelobates fuscus]|uniref:guanine nucleotide-binding protein G(I)/G(S)/G(O) subunit gamma-13 isoform X1 n=1 Tax=Pelobates fuscus TaxID=191477 RepID=UPI002FE45EB8